MFWVLNDGGNVVLCMLSLACVSEMLVWMCMACGLCVIYCGGVFFSMVFPCEMCLRYPWGLLFLTVLRYICVMCIMFASFVLCPISSWYAACVVHCAFCLDRGFSSLLCFILKVCS